MPENYFDMNQKKIQDQELMKQVNMLKQSASSLQPSNATPYLSTLNEISITLNKINDTLTRLNTSIMMSTLPNNPSVDYNKPYNPQSPWSKSY